MKHFTLHEDSGPHNRMNTKFPVHPEICDKDDSTVVPAAFMFFLVFSWITSQEGLLNVSVFQLMGKLFWGLLLHMFSRKLNKSLYR
jgi:hypothetical protein